MHIDAKPETELWLKRKLSLQKFYLTGEKHRL